MKNNVQRQKIEAGAKETMRNALLPFKRFLTSEISSKLALTTGLGGDKIEWFIYLPAENASDGKVIARVNYSKSNKAYEVEVYEKVIREIYEIENG